MWNSRLDPKRISTYAGKRGDSDETVRERTDQGWFWYLDDMAVMV